MSTPHGHGASHNPFSAAEWERFQADDRHAAAIIIGLMGCIFTMGLFLYLSICLMI